MIIKIKFKGIELKFYLERHSDFSAFYQVIVENNYFNLTEKIKCGDTVIDAGANIGMFTIIAALLTGSKGQVIAIEPDPDNVAILKKNIEINKFNNVVIINKALFNKSGKKIKLIQNGVMSKLVFREEMTNQSVTEVETITLDDLLIQNHYNPTILKMDIEGGEKFALLSSDKTMKEINFIEAEIHSEEDNIVVKKFSNEFIFKDQSIDSIHNLLLFIIKHPFKVLKLEFNNQFLTTRRVLLSTKTNYLRSKYPIIIYGERMSNKKFD